MTRPDYHAQAELYLGSNWETAQAQGSRTFRTAANALRFAFEEAAPVSLHCARLRIGDTEYSGTELARLYQSQDYPLLRKRRGGYVAFGWLARLPKKEPKMPKFDYEALAELYPSRRYAKSQQTQYRRFDRAAEAIRYVIEEMPAAWLPGSHLEVNERRFEGAAIRELYEAVDYPLSRLEVAA